MCPERFLPLGRAPHSATARPARSRGLTLVELLVVISIIGMLLAIMLPAVQSARESSRQAQCKDNLKQIGLAFLAHEQAHRDLPTGGWGWAWHGDPDGGYGRHQPGGWPYNILPNLDQGDLPEKGRGQPEPVKRAEGRQVAELALSVFYCPSRRAAYALAGLAHWKVKASLANVKYVPGS